MTRVDFSRGSYALGYSLSPVPELPGLAGRFTG